MLTAMDNSAAIAPPPQRKLVACRYFAASGTCFYGNDCQFLHTCSSSVSPTFGGGGGSGGGSGFPSPARGRGIPEAANGLDMLAPRHLQQQTYARSLSVSQSSSPSPSMDSLAQQAQSLSISSDSHAAAQHKLSLFEVPRPSSFYPPDNPAQHRPDPALSCLSHKQGQMGGTTYYFSPDETTGLELRDADVDDGRPSASLSRGESHSPPQAHPPSLPPFSVYAGPPSYLQNLVSQQRTSFFINDELRHDLIQRNALALASVDPSLFPGKSFTMWPLHIHLKLCSLRQIYLRESTITTSWHLSNPTRLTRRSSHTRTVWSRPRTRRPTTRRGYVTV